MAEPCAELEKQLAHEPVINSDETGYRTSGDKRWLWALVATGFVFYKIALTRGAEVLVQLLGEVFAGILCSDRCPTYLKYHKGEGQFCWAHFKRNILGVLEIAKTTEAERFCRDALALHARLFRLWHRFRAGPGIRYGPITREQLIAKSIPLEKKFFALAERYMDSRDKDVRNLALALLKHFEKFFAFLRNEGVEPTNNSAERALRCAVQWRKISFGSRSTQGEIAVATPSYGYSHLPHSRVESRWIHLGSAITVTPQSPTGAFAPQKQPRPPELLRLITLTPAAV